MADGGVSELEDQIDAMNIHEEAVGELRWGLVPGEVITINYVKYPRIRLRLVPSPQPSTCFVFLGEGDFSFSKAFAKLRGELSGVERPNWNGIVATDKEIQEGTIAGCLEIKRWPPRFEALGTLDPLCPRRLESRREFLTWLSYLGVNPDHIVLWFQCPWAYKMGYEQDGRDQEYFLRDIMAAAKNVQRPGELLLIGLCLVAKYVKRYGSPIEAATDNGYECLGADREFVGKMLDRRYQHQFNANSANTLTRNEQFATLLFRRKKLHPAQASSQHQRRSQECQNFHRGGGLALPAMPNAIAPLGAASPQLPHISGYQPRPTTPSQAIGYATAQHRASYYQRTNTKRGL